MSAGNLNEQRAQSVPSELLSYRRYGSHDKNARLFYRSCKYWHLPMIHGKEMSVVVAYAMYLEATEGNLMGEWKLDELMDFWRFRENLANGMLKYKPSARNYPGDKKMGPSTQQSNRQRANRNTRGHGQPRKK